jgi:hypothetical protein
MIHPFTAHEGPKGEQKNNPILFCTSVLREVRGQLHAPADFYPQQTHSILCTVGWLGARAGMDRC